MNGSAAQNLDPSGAFTETAAFSAAFKAGYVHLCAWLCKREMMRTEFCFCFRSEQFSCKLLKSSFQICKSNIFVNYKALDLMEGRRMGSVYLIRTEHSSRSDHADWQLAFLHGTGLYRRCLRTKQNGAVNKKCILLISCRMVLRNIQLGKVIVCILYLRTFHYLIAHSDKDSFHFLQGNGIWMTVSDH